MLVLEFMMAGVGPYEIRVFRRMSVESKHGHDVANKVLTHQCHGAWWYGFADLVLGQGEYMSEGRHCVTLYCTCTTQITPSDNERKTIG